MEPAPPQPPAGAVVPHPIENDDLVEVDELEEHESSISTNDIRPKRLRTKPPTDRTPGMTLLPMSKVEAIVQADGENGTLSKEAIYMLTVATEEFIKRFSQTAHGRSELDRRSLVQYRDMASTAYHFEEFQFLQDTVPMPIPLHRALALRASREQAATEADPFTTPTHSMSAFSSLSKGKGKVKARIINGVSPEQLNGKDRARDHKGRWSLASQSSISAASGGVMDTSMDAREGPSSISNGPSSSARGVSWNGNGIRSRPHRAWAPYPSPSSVQKDIPASMQMHSLNGPHANGVDVLHAAGSPLWTRVPLPPPPSANPPRRTIHPTILPFSASGLAGRPHEELAYFHPSRPRSPTGTHIPNLYSNNSTNSPGHLQQTTTSGTQHDPLPQQPPQPASPHETRSPPQDPTQGGTPPEYHSQMGQNPGRTIYSRQNRIDQ
ncbi:hypothetical protein BD410DRAFT_788943 [Rickenella mellea]|uniref:Transcription factor CBF/NF-Y/archaeal histone domain-containing protein n=1 Tax=Rickenella mellea TaxID=50990 RepID=A0A4Y7Q3I1_9AGAM|nr:hypothetical protein BD410DRAFT_788943 [Rickenella mellea]